MRTQKFLDPCNFARLEDLYQVDEVSASLPHAAMRPVVHHATGELRTLRVVRKSQVENVDRLRRRVSAVRSLDHPNVVKLHETFEDRRNIYFIFEHCDAGTMAEYVSRIHASRRMPEAKVARMMEQLLTGLAYLHGHNVCHKNLTLGSLYLCSAGENECMNLKIDDFDLEFRLDDGEEVRLTALGALGYEAPEVFASEYSADSDVWSCGAIMYELLFGYLPFRSPTGEGMRAQIKRACIFFNPADGRGLNESAKDLMREMMKKSQRERCSASDALESVWFSERGVSMPRAKRAVGRQSFGCALYAETLETSSTLVDFTVPEDIEEVESLCDNSCGGSIVCSDMECEEFGWAERRSAGGNYIKVEL